MSRGRGRAWSNTRRLGKVFVSLQYRQTSFSIPDSSTITTSLLRLVMLVMPFIRRWPLHTRIAINASHGVRAIAVVIDGRPPVDTLFVAMVTPKKAPVTRIWLTVKKLEVDLFNTTRPATPRAEEIIVRPSFKIKRGCQPISAISNSAGRAITA